MFVYLLDTYGNIKLSSTRLDVTVGIIDYLEFSPKDAESVYDYYELECDYLPRPLNKFGNWDEYEWRFNNKSFYETMETQEYDSDTTTDADDRPYTATTATDDTDSEYGW